MFLQAPLHRWAAASASTASVISCHIFQGLNQGMTFRYGDQCGNRQGELRLFLALCVARMALSWDYKDQGFHCMMRRCKQQNKSFGILSANNFPVEIQWASRLTHLSRSKIGTLWPVNQSARTRAIRNLQGLLATWLIDHNLTNLDKSWGHRFGESVCCGRVLDLVTSDLVRPMGQVACQLILDRSQVNWGKRKK